jgi:hypothetical protein
MNLEAAALDTAITTVGSPSPSALCTCPEMLWSA